MTAPYPPIPNEPWRKDAACAGRHPLFDDRVHGETPELREWRHHQAKALCRRCPVSFQCARTIDWTWDEGVRAGELLPEKKTAARPAEREIVHGTEGGYRAHLRRGETSCENCLIAGRIATANRKVRRAAS